MKVREPAQQADVTPPEPAQRAKATPQADAGLRRAVPAHVEVRYGGDLVERFRRRAALLEGHFLLSSGLHSSLYLQSALLLQHPSEAEAVGRELAGRVREMLAATRGTPAPTVVISPALGGVVVGQELARALGTRAVFAERNDGRMTLRRGFELGPGDVAVVCEDVITTGGSAAEVAALVRGAGASVIAVAALVHRGAEDPGLGAPLLALAGVVAGAWPPAACPQCAAGEPLVKPGSRGTKGSPTR